MMKAWRAHARSGVAASFGDINGRISSKQNNSVTRVHGDAASLAGTAPGGGDAANALMTNMFLEIASEANAYARRGVPSLHCSERITP